MLLGPFFVKFCALPEAVVRRCSIKKRVLHNFLGKRLCRSHFFDKAAGWRPETLLKRNFNAGIFLCIFLCRLPFFRMFVYVLLKFDWLIFFFSRRMLPRMLKILNSLFSPFFSAIFQRSRLHLLSFKIRRNFLPARKSYLNEKRPWGE